MCENFARSRASRMLPPPPPMMMMGPQPAPRQNTHTLDHQFVWLIKSAFLIRLCGDANYGRVEIESVPLRQLAVRPSVCGPSPLSSSALFAAAAAHFISVVVMLFSCVRLASLIPPRAHRSNTSAFYLPSTWKLIAPPSLYTHSIAPTD